MQCGAHSEYGCGVVSEDWEAEEYRNEDISGQWPGAEARVFRVSIGSTLTGGFGGSGRDVSRRENLKRVIPVDPRARY